MPILPVRRFGDPVLRQKAKRIAKVDKSIRRLVEDMIETMHDSHGVGLAAPQVGVSLRLIVIEASEDDIQVLVNPEIVKSFGERIVDEGCLSLPGYIGEVKRSVNLTVKAQNLDGKEIRIKADELLAQALEHEIDHINGVLFVDRLVSPDSLRKLTPEEAGRVAEA
jgi:peptide deformylase